MAGLTKVKGSGLATGAATASLVGIDDNATSTAITIDASENVGIGVASPVNALHIGGADGSSYIKFTSDATGHTGSDGARIGLNSDDLRIINAEPSGHMLFQTAATERMRINSAGDVTVNTGNLVIGTSGKGIDFSAVSDGSRSVSSNVLDDYEEGTWTPSFAGSTSAGTYTYLEQQGHYVKIGNQVTAWFNLTNIATSSAGSGTIRIKNLPFTVNWQSGFNGGGLGQVALNGFNNIGGDSTFLIAADNGTQALVYRMTGTSSTYDNISVTDITGGSSDVRGVLTYMV
jgi:hypothetical protein